MHGNVLQWTEDCYCDSYRGAPSDASARMAEGNEPFRVVRGGSFIADPYFLRSAHATGSSENSRPSSSVFVSQEPLLPNCLPVYPLWSDLAATSAGSAVELHRFRAVRSPARVNDVDYMVVDFRDNFIEKAMLNATG